MARRKQHKRRGAGSVAGGRDMPMPASGRDKSMPADGRATPAAPSPRPTLLNAENLAGAALVLLVAVVYWPALFAGFVWDDNTFIVGDKLVSGAGGIWDMWFAPSKMAEFHYWPVTYSAFWLEHKLWGFNPLGFHATNIALHGANTLLLWRLLARVNVPGAWAIAAVFALHPTHVEAVAWVIARKDLLGTLFYLLGVMCYLSYRERPRPGVYVMLLALYAVGALSKSVALTLPAALLLWVWWRHGRITRRDFTQIAPLFLLGGAIAAFDLSLFTAQAVHEFEYSLAERLVIASKALWFYVGKLLWPHPLLFMYPHWEVDPTRWLNWAGLVAAVAVALALWLARRRIGRGPLAGALFFFVTIAPVLGFADFGYMKFSFVADRYLYLPGIGLIAVLAAAAVMACRQLGGSGRRAVMHAGRMTLAVLLLAYGVVSFQRIHVFENEIGLFRHVVATNPAAPSAWFNLGTLLMEQNPTEAVSAFESALEYYPDDTQIYINLGSALLKLGRQQEAAAVLRRAIPLEPDDFTKEKAPNRARYLAAGVHYNLGNALLEMKRPAEAEQSLRRALALQPDNTQARQNLATALRQQGRHSEALAVLQQIVESAPSVHLYYQMGEIAAAQGDEQAAARFHRQALSIEPDNHSALQQQAALHFKAGRYEEALTLYQRAVALHPNNAEAHANLGSALGQLGRLAQAAQSFERALALDPALESARINLRVARQRMNAGAAR